jgi:hypothetical protein
MMKALAKDGGGALVKTFFPCQLKAPTVKGFNKYVSRLELQ